MSKVYKTTKVESTDKGLILSFCDFDPCDRKRFDFVICQRIPCCAQTDDVLIEFGGDLVPLWNRYGEQAVGSDICSRRLFRGWYSSSAVEHVITCGAPVE